MEKEKKNKYKIAKLVIAGMVLILLIPVICEDGLTYDDVISLVILIIGLRLYCLQ